MVPSAAGLSGTSSYPSSDEPVAQRLPTGSQVSIRVDDYADNGAVPARFESNRETIQQLVNAAMGLDIIELRTASIAAQVLEDVLVVNTLDQKDLLDGHVSAPRSGRAWRRPIRLRGTGSG